MRRRDVLSAGVGLLGVGAAGQAEAKRGRSSVGVHPEPYETFGRVEIEGAAEAVVGADGETAYVAADTGFATVDVSDPAAPTVLAERRGLLADHEDGPMKRILDVKIDGDRLLVAGPANAADGPDALLLYDVSDPSDPGRIGVHEAFDPIHNCFLLDGVAYFQGGDDQTAMYVVDFDEGDGDGSDAELQTDPELVGAWKPTDHDPAWEAVSPFLRPMHDLWVAEGRAYLACWDAGTFVLDVSDPASPSFLARIGGRPIEELEDVEDLRADLFQLPGNHHYVEAAREGTLLGVGKEAWDYSGVDGGGSGGVDLWDVSDLENPERLATIDPVRARDETIGGTWTTAHNFSFAGDRLYTSWYQGGVKIHDITDPADPTEIAWWRAPEEAAFWTAVPADGAVVASATDEVPGPLYEGLYLFPDHPGDQPDPPPFPTPTPEPTPTPTPTGTPPPETSEPGPTPTPARTPPVETSEPEPEPTPTPTPTPVPADGLGVLGGMTALGAAAWRRLRDGE